MSFNFKKKNLVFMVLIILAVVSLTYIYSVSQKQPPQTPPPPPPIPSPTFAPAGPVKLLYTDPQPGEHESIWVTTAIQFVFNQPVSLETLQYSITPNLALIRSLGETPNVLILRPAQEWKPKTAYKIKITKLLSPSGNVLETPIIFDYKFTVPDNIISD